MPQEGISKRKRIWVTGVVQGIGFRPYVYLLATQKDLRGAVYNTGQGVTIEVEGEEENIEEFLTDLQTKPPPLARINTLDVVAIPPRGETAFVIAESMEEGVAPAVVIPPDLALCPACLKELLDPADRRYRYPFINCTQCGPRLTIVKRVPYDRINTSMDTFRMCEECAREFHDPASRRFHAQPNACPRCGPHVWLAGPSGNPVPSSDPIRHAAQLLRQGAIVAIKGLGGFHLAVDATSEEAVRRLRQRKGREGKPFAIMSKSIEMVRVYAACSPRDEEIMLSPLHPILLLEKRLPCPIAPSVAPHQRCLGVMLSYTPVHVLLLQEGFAALVMTSGNRSEEPIAIGNEEALESLSSIADCFLFHDREILVRCDDSVVMPVGKRAVPLRRARGYVPLPIRLKSYFEPVLALGGQMKNTICVLLENQAFLSQHIGDMDAPAARGFFGESLKRFQEIAGVCPRIVAHDSHPDYYTTRVAEGMKDAARYAIQHHHAHMVSCMADNELEGPVAGLIFDGTGYGTDGTIWGGEVLVGDACSFKRVAHCAPFPLPGGESAILHPWRIALGLFHTIYGDRVRKDFCPLIERMTSEDEVQESSVSLIYAMVDRGINTPITSSMGRLFDAVSAMLGFRRRITYEGEAAIELEYYASLSEDKVVYPVSISREGSPWRLEIAPMLHALIEDIGTGHPREVISRRFHNSIIRMAVEAALSCCRGFSVTRVVLSGGCFQNRILLEGVMAGLRREGVTPFMHSHVPPNDGGISLGQAICAGALHRESSSR